MRSGLTELTSKLLLSHDYSFYIANMSPQKGSATDSSYIISILSNRKVIRIKKIIRLDGRTGKKCIDIGNDVEWPSVVVSRELN